MARRGRLCAGGRLITCDLSDLAGDAGQIGRGSGKQRAEVAGHAQASGAICDVWAGPRAVGSGRRRLWCVLERLGCGA